MSRKSIVHILIDLSFSGPNILVKVGASRHNYNVNEGLRRSSGFFDTALKQEWREGQECVIELPKDDPESFNAYINWLCSRHVTLGFNEGQSVKSL